MPKLYNLAKMTTATSGAGTITLDSAVSGFLSFADAGVSDAEIVRYTIRDGADSEVGYGTYTSSGTTLSRTVVKSTNSDAAIDLSGAAQVAITAIAEDVRGLETVGLPAVSWFPATTNGCAVLAQGETSGQSINYRYLAFDSSSAEFAWLWFPSPKSYDASTVTFRVTWTHPATATNFGVAWTLAILALADDDAIDTALGTAVTVTDTGGTTEDFYITSVSSAVTPGNTAAKQDWFVCRIGRDPDNGSDDLAVDAHLVGVEIYINTDAGTDD